MQDDITAPNLFCFATGELSQDAFLAWLANWADDKYVDIDPSLNVVARDFLVELSGGAFIASDICIIKTKLQFKKTDVVIAVTLRAPRKQKHLIVIEDKTSSGQHNDQLERYKKEIKEEIQDGDTFKDHMPHYVYYKTHDHITRSEHLYGFCNFSRTDALKIFEGPTAKQVQNNIFIDYVAHLRKMEDSSNAYKHLPTDGWKYSQWSGFLMAVCKQLADGANFGYVPNASGGFIGAWFGWVRFPHMIDGDDVYLQLGGKKAKAPYFDLKVRVASASQERTEWLKDYVLPILKDKFTKAKIECLSKNIRKGRSVAIISLTGIVINETENKVEALVAEISKIMEAMQP